MSGLATYADLQTAVTDWLDVSTSDMASRVPDIITIGEKWIFRKCRTRDMITVVSGTISTSGILALPTSYVALENAVITTAPTQSLDRKTNNWIYDNYPDRVNGSKPKFIAREAGYFIFGPYPDSAYTVQTEYYMRLAAVNDTSTGNTNAVFQNWPDLYLYSSLVEAEPFIKRDPRMPLWKSKRDEILADVNGEDNIESFSGGPLRVTAG